MSTVEIINGDSLQVLKSIPDSSVQMCVTSPPYYGLRDYGAEGQIGLEDTPQEFIDRLVCVFREVRRVLKDDGTLWLNIGDSYCGTGDKGNYKDPKYEEGRNGQRESKTKDVAGCKHKDLIGIPWMLAFALRNDGWYLRQDIIWQKPNPMPESVRDRCTKSHEYIFLLSKKPQYYFDSYAISEPVADSTVKRVSQNIEEQQGSQIIGGGYSKPMKARLPRFGGNKYGDNADQHHRTASGNEYDPSKRYKNLAEKGQQPNSMHQRRAEGQKDIEYARRNKRDVWTVSTKPYSGAHFATFPEDLILPCILAGSKEGDTVLDPFNGAATTGVVCRKNKRNYIGIELNPEYVKLSNERLKRIDDELYMQENQMDLFGENLPSVELTN